MSALDLSEKKAGAGNDDSSGDDASVKQEEEDAKGSEVRQDTK